MHSQVAYTRRHPLRDFSKFEAELQEARQNNELDENGGNSDADEREEDIKDADIEIEQENKDANAQDQQQPMDKTVLLNIVYSIAISAN